MDYNRDMVNHIFHADPIKTLVVLIALITVYIPSLSAGLPELFILFLRVLMGCAILLSVAQIFLRTFGNYTRS